MRTIKPLKTFRRDYRRELSAAHGKKLDSLLEPIVAALAADEELPRSKSDHRLTGTWKDCCDCHVRPDLILIYRKPDAATLELVWLGSHSALGLQGRFELRKASPLDEA